MKTKVEKLAEGMSPPKGIMIALKVPMVIAASIAIPGGELAEDLHLTVCYIPNLGTDESKKTAIVEAISPLTQSFGPVMGTIGGTGKFFASEGSEGRDVFYASFNSPGLEKLRAAIVNALTSIGIELTNKHGFTPHITLKYIEPGEEAPDFAPMLPPFAMECLQVGSASGLVELQFTGVVVLKKKEDKVKKNQPGGSSVHVPSTEWEPMKKMIATIAKKLGITKETAEDVPPVQNVQKDPMGSVVQGEATNATDGLYSMNQLISGMDWELSNGSTDEYEAKELALDNLAKDTDYYRKKMLGEDWTDDVLAKGKVDKDTQENEEDPMEGMGNQELKRGLWIDGGSGHARIPGHIGLDTYPYDYGTAVHDLNLGLPLDDSSVSKFSLVNVMDHPDAPDIKATLSEIQRVLMPGGQFVYQGPNEIQNYPEFLEETYREGGSDGAEEPVTKIEGTPPGAPVRQEFTRLATPDAATSNDAEPRIGIAQYDQLPADALLAMDALGYYWSDATSSGRGNRASGYASQGALVNKPTEKASKKEPEEDPSYAIAKASMECEDEDSDEEDYDQMSFKLAAAAVEGPVGLPEIKKGGPGSGPQAGSGKITPDHHSEMVSQSQQRLASAKNKLLQEQQKPGFFKSQSYADSASEFRSARRAHNTNLKNAKSFVSAHKSIEKGGPGSGPQGGGSASKDQKANENRLKLLQSQASKDKARWDTSRAQVHKSKKVQIFKASPMKQIVYGVILTPEEVDQQEDFMSADDIEQSAHAYLVKSRTVGAMHQKPIHAEVVESYIAPQDFKFEGGQYGPQVVKKGSWVMGVRVKDPKEWAKVVNGDYQAFSVGGFGARSTA